MGADCIVVGEVEGESVRAAAGQRKRAFVAALPFVEDSDAVLIHQLPAELPTVGLQDVKERHLPGCSLEAINITVIRSVHIAS